MSPPSHHGMMKALRFHGQRDIRVEMIPIPKCGSGQVKVKPAFVGICGSDLHEYLGGANFCPLSPHPITGEIVPVTMGHEFSGTIEEVGEGIDDLEVGETVCVQPIIYDQTCPACLDGHINCCWQFGFIGLSGWGGGLSEHVVMPRRQIIKLPKSIPLDIGALVEPLAVGWHAVNVSDFKKGDTALVLGGGPIGLSVIQALKARGCHKIIVSEVSEKRKEFARDFGAHFVYDPSKDDIVKECRDLTDNRGVDFIFDAAGVQAAVATSVLALRIHGSMVNIAIWEKDLKLIPNDWMFKERKWITSATYRGGDFEEIIEALASGALKPAPMITMKIKLDEVVEKGFTALIENKDKHVKILVEID